MPFEAPAALKSTMDLATRTVVVSLDGLLRMLCAAMLLLGLALHLGHA
jgi:hypothetical protein